MEGRVAWSSWPYAYEYTYLTNFGNVDAMEVEGLFSLLSTLKLILLSTKKVSHVTAGVSLHKREGQFRIYAVDILIMGRRTKIHLGAAPYKNSVKVDEQIDWSVCFILPETDCKIEWVPW